MSSRSAAALCAAALAAGCAAPAAQPALARVSEGRPAMGTILEITLVTSDAAKAHAALERCFAEVARLESVFTSWRADGELARLNAHAGRGPQRASPELIRILLEARAFATSTDGAFDVTVGPLVQLWRVAGERGTLPSAAELALARSRVGIERVAIDEASASIALEAGMAIDLGGLAKGWTLDRIGEALRSEGFARALLNFGGSSLLALGSPDDGPGWRIRVGAGPLLELRDVSVSVSDSFGQLVEIGGRRFSHIVDPRTGLPIQHAQRAIVFAEAGSTAEAWSTALVVFPAAEGIARLESRAEAQARIDDANGVTHRTAGEASRSLDRAPRERAP